MGAARFGDLLRRVVPLSPQDVAEILDAQAVSRRRFGEIALSWGLCQPEDVWQAWIAQLAHRIERVDLRQIGIDTQALKLVPAAIAREFGVVPVRALCNQVILATTDDAYPRALSDIPPLIAAEVRFVLCEQEQLDEALAVLYAPGAEHGNPLSHCSLEGASTI
jgi:type IV pilus assembly protein PilB